jgi:outer membrane receptor protein involved in Fe transport
VTVSHLPRFHRFGAATLLATTILTTAGMAHAQTAAPADAASEASDQGDIVVTAQKRSESIQKVPISMQALGTETLAQHQVNNLDDYTKLLPSVSFQTYGPGQSDLSFRGVATGGINLPGGSLPTVGVYLDEIPVSTIGAFLDVHAYDLARVEALSGPQGTLYGASSLSGTLRLITNKPDPSKIEGGYDLQLNKFGKGAAGGVGEGFINLPISDKAAVRIVGFYEYDGGYIDNTPASRTYTLSDADPTNDKTVNNSAFVKKSFNTVETYGGRVALGIDLDDNWTVTPTVVGQYQKAKGFFGVDPKAGDLAVHEFAPDLNIDKWYLAALTIEGKIGDFDLHYTGGYLKRSIHNDQDYSYYTVYYDNITGYTNFPDGKGGFLDPTQRYHNTQHMNKISQEFRVSTPKENRFRMTAGLFYQRQANKNLADYYVPGLGATGYPVTLGDDVFTTNTKIVDRDYAVFAEANFDITRTLTLTGGVRGFKARNTLTGFSGFASNAAAVGCTLPINLATCSNIIGPNGPGKVYKETGETHKFNLTWQIDPDHMVYGTYSTGFRPGGNNRRPGINPYDADTIDNFELGWKTSWLDHHLRFNGAAYYEKWNKLQYTLAPVGSVGVVNIYNSGNAHIKGAELQLQYATGGLTLSGSGTFTDAKLTTPFCAINAAGNSDCSTGAVAAPAGTRLPVQPRFKSTGTARYDFDWDGHESFLQGSWLHQTGVKNFLATADDAAVGRTGTFNTFDFSIGVKAGGISFEAFIQNAFDKRGILSKNTFCAPTYCGIYARSYPVKPQFFGMKVSQRF